MQKIFMSSFYNFQGQAFVPIMQVDQGARVTIDHGSPSKRIVHTREIGGTDGKVCCYRKTKW